VGVTPWQTNRAREAQSVESGRREEGIERRKYGKYLLFNYALV
jgi:hypothetical protein